MRQAFRRGFAAAVVMSSVTATAQVREGQNVTIRGLPTAFSQVQLNGRSLASALGTFDSQPSRSFDTFAFNDSLSSVLEATNILDEAQMVRARF